MKYIFLCVFFLSFSVIAIAQDENSDNEKPLTKNQEKNLSLKQQLELANEALLFADSLFDNGAELIKSSKDNIKMIQSDKKEYLEDYKIKKKALNKTITGDDKAATDKKANDLKTMDVEYKEKMKKFDTDIRDNQKKLGLGEKIYAKGEEKKTAAKDKIKSLTDSLKETEIEHDK